MSHYLKNFKERHKDEFEGDELDKRLLELSALFEISRTLNSSLNLKTILDNILLVPMGRMMISKGVILIEQSRHQYRVENLKGLPRTLLGKEIHISLFPEHAVLISENPPQEDWVEFFNKFNIDLLIPLVSGRDMRGLLGFSRKLTGQPYSDDEINFLSSLGNIAVQAIENGMMFDRLHQVNRELDHRIQELNTLFEIGKELNQIFDPHKILKQLSYSLMGQMLINQFFVMLKNDEGQWEVAFQKGSRFRKERLQSCIEACKKLPELPEPLRLEEDSEYPHIYEAGVRLIVPMSMQGKVGGLIFLGERIDQKAFTGANIDFLSTLANMAMISLENAHLIQETIEKERLEEDLHLARDIQRKLLPDTMPELANYDVHGLNIASRQVGGDYFDIIQLDDRNYLLTIADVSGKGMAAALLVSNLQAGLHTLCGDDLTLDEITFRLNNLIHKNTDIEKYITFFILKLNIKDGTFSYVNAGHNPPFLFKPDGDYETLEKGGLILGMMPNIRYDLGEGSIKNGQTIFMYTDGVSEAMDQEGREFEEKGIIQFFRKSGETASCKDLNDALINEVKTFAVEPEESDDITLLTIRRLHSS